jgi:hypothetical protein
MSAESTARPQAATAAGPERIKLSLIRTIRPNSFKPHQSSPRINVLMCHVNSCWPQAACHLHRANVTDSDKVGCGSITEQTQSGRYRQSWTVKLNFWTQFSRSDSELLTRSTAGPKLGAGGVTSRSHGRPAVPDHRVPLRVHFTHMMDWATSRIFYLCAKPPPADDSADRKARTLPALLAQFTVPWILISGSFYVLTEIFRFMHNVSDVLYAPVHDCLHKTF